MNEAVHQQRQTILATYGSDICTEPQRCEALLRDLCGDQRLAIDVLVGALKGHVAADLLTAAPSVPSAVLLAQLAQRLEDEQALTE